MINKKYGSEALTSTPLRLENLLKFKRAFEPYGHKDRHAEIRRDSKTARQTKK
jgi:hypothetical protein